MIQLILFINVTPKREFLKRRLFSANEILQNVLVHIRNLCEEASSSANGRGSNDQTEILMIRFDPSVTYTLDEFRSVQYEQIDLALHRLQALKEEIMNICYLACIVIKLLFNFYLYIIPFEI